MSEAKSNLYGVSQRSILGPILFNIFINDNPKIHSLPEITTSTTIYADNVQLLFSGTHNNLEQLKIYAETRLKTMKEWYSENGLKMNSNKTQCILFCNTKFQQTDWDISNTIHDTVRHIEDSQKSWSDFWLSSFFWTSHQIILLLIKWNSILSK